MTSPFKMTVLRTAAVLALLLLLQARAISQDQILKLTASDGAVGDAYGTSVDISGSRVIVGASMNTYGGIFSGSAYIHDAGSGQELFQLLPIDRQSGMQFGGSVAIAGDRAMVGAGALSGLYTNSGAAYLFDVATGQQLHKLVPLSPGPGFWFGISVAIEGNYLVVGAPGDTVNGTWSGSVFVFDAATGQELRKLVPFDGTSGDNFGCSVAISGDRVIVGAFYDDPHGWISGSAYVFDVTTGNQLRKIAPSDGAAQDQFGWCVDLDGDRALIGAHLDDDQGQDSGSAYLFDVTTGYQIHKLLPSQGSAYGFFGYALSLSGGAAIVGAPFELSQFGCAYSFDASTGVEHGRMRTSPPSYLANLGWAVGVSGPVAVLGAPQDGNQGAAYLFEVAPSITSYCFGDPGSGTPCPCANDNDGTTPGAGCANGASAAGAQLTVIGTASVSQDDLILAATGLDPLNSGLYFQANNRVNSGDGIPFGEGLRCAGGGLVRLQVRSSDSLGVSLTTTSISGKGGVAAGDTRRYQCWYRDNSGGQPCGAGVYDFNLTNAIEITWRP